MITMEDPPPRCMRCGDPVPSGRMACEACIAARRELWHCPKCLVGSAHEQGNIPACWNCSAVMVPGRI